MKPTKSLSALSVALLLHGVVGTFLWIALSHTNEEEKAPHQEKRLGILLQEEEPTESVENSSLLSASQNPTPKRPPPPPTKKSTHNPIPNETITLQPFTPSDRDTLPFSVLHHYGEAFFTLSAGEQHYIINHLQRIRKINEIVGTRLLRERYHDDVDPDDNNIVTFTLHPDGTISDLELEKNRIGTPLDELTLQTIQLAHPKYPKPSQPTKVRIRVYVIVK